MQANVGPTNASGNGVSVTPPTNKSISLGCLKKIPTLQPRTIHSKDDFNLNINSIFTTIRH